MAKRPVRCKIPNYQSRINQPTEFTELARCKINPHLNNDLRTRAEPQIIMVGPIDNDSGRGDVIQAIDTTLSITIVEIGRQNGFDARYRAAVTGAPERL